MPTIKFIKFVMLETLLTIGAFRLLRNIENDVSNVIHNFPVIVPCSYFTPVNSVYITYALYMRKNRPNGTNLVISSLTGFDPKARFIIIVHGWLQNGKAGWIIQMVNAYLDREAANVIVTDWSYYTKNIYSLSYCAVPEVGRLIGELLNKLITDNITHYEQIQIIGFSLGGHIGGYAGQTFASLNNGNLINRIIGLDIAGPGYYGLPEKERLDKSDATSVIGFHSGIQIFGYANNYGTVDFYFNYILGGCGKLQPGCPLNPGVPTNFHLSTLPMMFCPHIRSVVYFIESINSTSFLAVKCTCSAFGSNRCNKSGEPVVVGENTPLNATGERYLNTNSHSPFAMGSQGLGGSVRLIF